MDHLSKVRDLADQAASQFPENIAGAVDWLESESRKLPEFESLVKGLLREALQQLVYASRHKTNVAIKRQAGYYDSSPKVQTDSPAVLSAYRSTYDYCMGKRTLGSLRGDELEAIGLREGKIAEGHLFNKALAEWLRTLVPDGKTVRECVPEKTLRANFRRLFKEVYGVEAA